jgi:hypothetical protein
MKKQKAVSDMAKESICRNCFHSYVCEQFNENRDDNNEKCHFFNDHYVPTADVVPKSEVEELREINSLLAAAGQAWQKHYENLAREIFEEIDRMIFGTIIPNDCAIISIAQLAELKKKYTEGAADNGSKQ